MIPLLSGGFDKGRFHCDQHTRAFRQSQRLDRSELSVFVDRFDAHTCKLTQHKAKRECKPLPPWRRTPLFYRQPHRIPAEAAAEQQQREQAPEAVRPEEFAEIK